jgi:hypothetical protein
VITRKRNGIVSFDSLDLLLQVLLGTFCFTLGAVLLATANDALEDVNALVGSMYVAMRRSSCYVQTPEVPLISKRSIGIPWHLHISDRYRTSTV